MLQKFNEVAFKKDCRIIGIKVIMYLKEFEIRWNDLDANRHLANSAYINYMSHTRMSFLTEYGLDQKMLKKHKLGPVVFNEHIHFFKESVQGRIRVSFELGGASVDGMFFRFIHNFYDMNGHNMAYGEMKGGWMDLESRKLTSLPDEMLSRFSNAPKSDDFQVLTKNDMRVSGISPKDL